MEAEHDLPGTDSYDIAEHVLGALREAQDAPRRRPLARGQLGGRNRGRGEVGHLLRLRVRVRVRVG